MSSNFGFSALLRVFNERSSEVRSRIIGIYVFLIGYNVIEVKVAPSLDEPAGRGGQ